MVNKINLRINYWTENGHEQQFTECVTVLFTGFLHQRRNNCFSQKKKRKSH